MAITVCDMIFFLNTETIFSAKNATTDRPRPIPIMANALDNSISLMGFGFPSLF